MASSPANNRCESKAQFQGANRVADGYEYWTISQEDEEALDVHEREASADTPPTPKAKQSLLAPGVARRTAVRLGAIVLIAGLLAVAYFVFNFAQVRGAADVGAPAPADAIVVLGAAQYNGAPSGVLRERLDHAFELWEKGVAPVIMTTGAGQAGDITTEGLAGFSHLRDKGVPEEVILVIPEGTNTYEQLSASQFQMLKNEFASVILVSDSYHNHRLLQIADELEMANVQVSPSGVEATIRNELREAAAVSIGRITGYRRLSSFT